VHREDADDRAVAGSVDSNRVPGGALRTSSLSGM